MGFAPTGDSRLSRRTELLGLSIQSGVAVNTSIKVADVGMGTFAAKPELQLAVLSGWH